MDTAFMNSENRIIRLKLLLPDHLDLGHTENNKSKFSVQTWNQEFDLSDSLYSISDIHNYTFNKKLENILKIFP